MSNTYFQAVNLWNEIPQKLNPIRFHYVPIWRENFRKYGTVEEEQKLTFRQLEAIENTVYCVIKSPFWTQNFRKRGLNLEFFLK